MSYGPRWVGVGPQTYLFSCGDKPGGFFNPPTFGGVLALRTLARGLRGRFVATPSTDLARRRQTHISLSIPRICVSRTIEERASRPRQLGPVGLVGGTPAAVSTSIVQHRTCSLIRPGLRATDDLSATAATLADLHPGHIPSRSPPPRDPRFLPVRRCCGSTEVIWYNKV